MDGACEDRADETEHPSYIERQGEGRRPTLAAARDTIVSIDVKTDLRRDFEGIRA